MTLSNKEYNSQQNKHIVTRQQLEYQQYYSDNTKTSNDTPVDSVDIAFMTLNNSGRWGQEALHRLIYSGKIDSALALFRHLATQDGEHDSAFVRRAAGFYHQIGALAFLFGFLDSAEEMFTKELALREIVNNKEGIANLLVVLGDVSSSQNDLNKTQHMYEEALKLYKELGYLSNIATQHNKLACIHIERGALEEAKQNYIAALNIYEEIGDRPDLAMSFSSLGDLYEYTGALDTAKNMYENALVIFRELGLDRFAVTVEEKIRTLERRKSGGNNQTNVRYPVNL